MTIEDIRQGLETRLAAIESLRVQQEWGENPNVSGGACVAVVEYDGTTLAALKNAAHDIQFKVTVLASKVSDRAGRQKLDVLAEHTDNAVGSVRTAVQGIVNGTHYCYVESNTGYREYPIGEQAYLGVEFVLSVAA